MFSKSIISASILLTSAAAQSNNSTGYATGLIGALTSLNLTTLLGAVEQNVALLPLLDDGLPKIVFAPSNAAFSNAPQGALNDSSFVTNLIKYHVLNTSVPTNSAEHYIAHSYLNSTSYVNLPGGESQVVVLSGASNDSITVVQALGNINSTGSAVYQNLHVYIIDTLLTIPGNLTSVATAAGLTSLTGALTQYAPSVVPTLVNHTGLTVFAPTNQAFNQSMAAIGTLNMSQIANVLENHVVLSGVVYSSDIKNGANVTTASGEVLTLITNSTGVFVQSGSIVAKVIMSDVLIENGVVHVIDTVLANTASNSTAASGASVASNSSSNSTSTASGSNPSSTKAASSATQLLAGSLAGTLAFVAALLI